MSLATYKKKRAFDHTPKPTGGKSRFAALNLNLQKSLYSLDQSLMFFISRANERLRVQGCFKDKIWASYSCFEAADENLAIKLIRDEGAKGVLYFGSTINPYATKEVIRHFQKLDNNDNLNVTEKVQQAIKNALNENRGLNDEINKIYDNFIIETSFNIISLHPNNIAA